MNHDMENAGQGGVMFRGSRPRWPHARVSGPLATDRRITDGAFRTLAVVDALCAAEPRGEISRQVVALLRGISRRALYYHCTELSAAGLVSIRHRGKGTRGVITLADQETVYGKKIGTFLRDVLKVPTAKGAGRRRAPGRDA